MKYPVPRLLVVLIKTTLFAMLVCLAAPAHSSVLSEDSVQDFQVSGPVALNAGQNASVCATNLDDSPVSILIGLLQADTPGLLASKEVTLASGAGACLNFTRQLQPNGNPRPAGNVIGVIVPRGHVSQGAIVQDRPGGGGCITASLQIQFGQVGNLPGPTSTPTLVTGDALAPAGATFLYVPMQEHHDAQRRRGQN